ncbi:hypothetical protein IWX90DRAFT_416891 [Phyllosticta citrichinensis]|uniref:Uncharacterized protein n=1 Tax=Phyllosticta citrichinensis TaxID=1130410 RepID=A0ABR1XNV8_9PEZI
MWRLFFQSQLINAMWHSQSTRDALSASASGSGSGSGSGARYEKGRYGTPCLPCFLSRFSMFPSCRPHRLFCDVDGTIRPSTTSPALHPVLVPASPNLQTRPSPCSCTSVALPNLSAGPNILDMAAAAIAMNRPRPCPLTARSFSRSRKIKPWRFLAAAAPRPSGKEYPLPALVACPPVLLRMWSLPNQETSGLKWTPPSTVCIKKRSKRCKLQRPQKFLSTA